MRLVQQLQCLYRGTMVLERESGGQYDGMRGQSSSHGATRRMLWQALLVSLAVHAVFLLQQPEEPGGATTSTGQGGVVRLDARLRAVQGVLPASAERLQSSVPAAQKSLSLSDSPAPSALSGLVDVRRQPAVRAPGQAFSVAPVVTMVPMNQSPVSLPSPLHVVPASVRQQTEAAGAVPDDGLGKHELGVHESLRAYRIDLALAARRFRDDPQEVLDSGAGGVVQVRLAIDEAGRAGPGVVQHSSGNGELDAAAVALMDRAAQQVGVPTSLLGRAFQMVITVEFVPAAGAL
ncbi:MAG: TonB family protein [Sterolibacterium sp.]|nr:TonB family protein [Sterolibacterium sp.]MBP9800315.1 TonB family protein [Sterolibacterium sp.]